MAERDIQLKKKVYTIVATGISGAGKSTLLNSLFGITLFKTGLNPDPVTESLITHTETRHNVTVQVVDTIGLEAGQAERMEQLKEISEYVKGEADIILYCVPVGPGQKFKISNPAIMQSLQDAFGKDIWKRCILVFTHSNQAMDHCSGQQNDQEIAISQYKIYVTEFAKRFYEQLPHLGVNKVDVKAVFDAGFDSELASQPNTMIAVPAGFKEKDQVLPGCESLFKSTGNYREEEFTWINILTSIIFTQAKPESTVPLLEFRYGSKIVKEALELYGLKVTIGGALGGTIVAVKGGAVLGVKAGILGAKAGTIIGGPPAIIVGAIVGTIIGGTAGAVLAVVTEKNIY